MVKKRKFEHPTSLMNLKGVGCVTTWHDGIDPCGNLIILVSLEFRSLGIRLSMDKCIF
jgi:hypothetical protein